ncbi:MAG TPA: hypothetical protein VGA93_03360 [Actinomycetota bacterium]
MDTCWNCGAGLSPGIGWCGQCFEPVVRLPEASDDRALAFDDLRIVHAPAPAIHQDEVSPERCSSLLRGGPTTPAIAGKLVLTAAVVAAGAGLYSMPAVLAQAVGRPAIALMIVLLGAYSVIAGLVLWSAWRPERQPRSLRADRKVPSVRPARRRADDFTTPIR